MGSNSHNWYFVCVSDMIFKNGPSDTYTCTYSSKGNPKSVVDRESKRHLVLKVIALTT